MGHSNPVGARQQSDPNLMADLQRIAVSLLPSTSLHGAKQINHTPLRPSRGSEVVFDPVGLLPDDDSKRRGQVPPACAPQTTNLDESGQPGE